MLQQELSKKFYDNFKKRFFNTYEFSIHDINRFILLLRKDVYPYECRDDWEKFRENSLHGKGDFYSDLNMEVITDANYGLAKRVCKYFEIEKLWQYHNLHVQNNYLMHFRFFKNMCLEIYDLNKARFLSPPVSELQSAIKKTKVKLDLLTDIEMLSIVEKGSRDGICRAIYLNVKANGKLHEKLK